MKAAGGNPPLPMESNFSPGMLVTSLPFPRKPRVLILFPFLPLTSGLYEIKQFITENITSDYYPKYNQEDTIQYKLINSKLL